MRIPWIATLDALIDELNQHLPVPVPRQPERRGRVPLSVIGIVPVAGLTGATAPSPDDTLRDVIERLLAVRRTLMDTAQDAHWQKNTNPRQWMNNWSLLPNVDASEVRYPEFEGREGLALSLEKGGLIGPVLGQHIASVIRGTYKFKPGPQYSFEEGRWRRLVVKRIATIQYLYALGLRAAVGLYRDHYVDDDPEATAPDRFERWVKEDRKMARSRLAADDLPPEDQRHFQAILDGICPHLPRGALKGRTFPEGFNDALKTRSTTPPG